MNRQNDRNLRQYILDECFIDGIISLPLKTFFTTIKKTYILAITKKPNKKDIQIDPIFTYLVSEIGESRDIYRFDIEQNDLQEAVTLYSFFKGNKKGFEKINSDKRCKIVDIEIFRKSIEKSWDIDKFWTKKEKVELGVVENGATTKFEEFPQILEETSNNILVLRDELLELSNAEKESKTNFVYKKIKLFVLFDIKSGNSELTKNFVEKNKGDFVVYSANTKENGVFGYINTFDYDQECIQITTNGVYAGTVFYREKHKFSINGDARLLIKKSDNLDYYYLLFELQKEFKEHNFNWENKPTVGKLRDIEIQIPVDKD